MMLKTLVRRFLLVGVVFLAGFIFGCLNGYGYAYWFSIYPSETKKSERDHAFLNKLESLDIAPPCQGISKVGFSEPHKKDGIIYYVNVHDEMYEVIGLSADSSGPLISWYGAGLQPCNEAASSNPALKRDALKRAP